MIGVWRSYQSFYHNGNIRKHSLNYYDEIGLTDDASLILKSFSKFTNTRELKNGDWEIQSWDRRRFLFLEGMKSHEIITFDLNDIVLLDAVTGEKIFYAALTDWMSRLGLPTHDNDEIFITLWSNSLIDAIKIEEEGL